MPTKSTYLSQSIGKAVKEARKAANITQADLGAASGLCRAAVRRLELGQANPRLSTLEALCYSLGMTFNTLMCNVMYAELHDMDHRSKKQDAKESHNID